MYLGNGRFTQMQAERLWRRSRAGETVEVVHKASVLDAAPQHVKAEMVTHDDN
jgi:hypothetical protein